MSPPRWTAATGYPLCVAARILRVSRAELGGILRAYGMRPTSPVEHRRRGKPPLLLAARQVDEIRGRLAAADRDAA